MLAYCWVIIDDVDPQLRQRLVFTECSKGRCEKHLLFKHTAQWNVLREIFISFKGVLKGLAQDKIIKKLVILCWLLYMTL